MKAFQEAPAASPIGRLCPRTRLVATFALAVFTVSLEEWRSLGLVLALSVGLLALAGMLNMLTSKRLSELNFFMVLLALLLPLSTPGRPLFELGCLAWTSEGLSMAGSIALKANGIMLFSSGLLATVEPSRLGYAMHCLKLPSKLVHVCLFMVRYIDVLHVEYQRVTNAMRLRGFRWNCRWHALRGAGYLVGGLFVRSLDRANRILDAMKCRGFHGRLYVLTPLSFGAGDLVALLLLLAALGGIGWLEWVA